MDYVWKKFNTGETEVVSKQIVTNIHTNQYYYLNNIPWVTYDVNVY